MWLGVMGPERSSETPAGSLQAGIGHNTCSPSSWCCPVHASASQQRAVTGPKSHRKGSAGSTQEMAQWSSPVHDMSYWHHSAEVQSRGKLAGCSPTYRHMGQGWQSGSWQHLRHNPPGLSCCSPQGRGSHRAVLRETFVYFKRGKRLCP